MTELEELRAELRAAREQLVTDRVRFYEAGGVVTLNEWAQLPEVDQDACRMACLRVRIGMIERLAVALGGPFGVALVKGELDGYDEHDNLVLEAHTHAVVAEHQARMHGVERVIHGP